MTDLDGLEILSMGKRKILCFLADNNSSGELKRQGDLGRVCKG